MMANLPYQIMDSIEKLGIGWNVLLPLILFSLVFLYVSGVVQRARYRISINKINIHNRFKQYSYLDIMLNPAGGMPFMYAMSLVSIPQYVDEVSVMTVLDTLAQSSLHRFLWITGKIGRAHV